MRNRNLKIAVGIGAAALVAAGAVGVAGLAGAEPAAKATTFVDGFGTVTDDFGDHHGEVGTLCDGCANSQGTDLVMVWQSILAADGYLSGGEIDGYFGPTSAEATKEWKSDRGLDANGRVGDTTWSRADDNLELHDDGSVSYSGRDREFSGSVTFVRDEETGAYEMHQVRVYDGAPWGNIGKIDRIWMAEKSIVLEEDEL